MAIEPEPIDWSKRLVDRPINPAQALRFDGPDALKNALDVIERLDLEEPLALIHAPTRRRPSVILLESSYPRLVDALIEANVEFREVPTAPISTLSVDDQRLFRRGPR